ncbi:hypothetical protein FDK38_003715 [Candidozyma auris]|nr:hypothetical protein FDK38_003715 [[Candida] auris]
MASVSVVRARGATNEHGFSRSKIPVAFTPPQEKEFSSSLPFRVDYFVLNNTEYVLVKSLAKLWNYPSSYQVIARIVKKTGIPKSDFLFRTTQSLNESLLAEGLLSTNDADKQQFYIPFRFLYSIIENVDVLVGEDPIVQNTEAPEKLMMPANDEDHITVSQVFPSYGHVESSLRKDHATFLTLTPLTKLQVYKHEGTYKRVYGSSLSASERELIIRNNNYANFNPGVDADVNEKGDSGRKPLGRSKRQVGSVDPNSLDVSENILPGNGTIPEFSVGPLCRVPNYFVTSGSMNSMQQAALLNAQRPHLSKLQLKFADHKVSKQVQQLLLNNDQEALHSKYYYYKSYRGPGSGNYKDAALVNKINKIRMFSKENGPSSNAVTHLPAHKVRKPMKRRFNRPVKGLIHECYSPENLEVVVNRQRQFTEDFTNLEVLHSTVLFNVLANSYREVSQETWASYYKFRMIDFEKLYSIEKETRQMKRKEELLAEFKKAREEAEASGGLPPQPSKELAELTKPNLTERFTLPTDHVEIMQKLPLELRGDSADPVSQISKPIRYLATYPDKQMPEVLNQIEVVKLPNANSLAWDNIKKYREA